MSDLSDIEKPTLLLNRAIAQHNIEHMARKALKTGTRFRPHFKTHQSAEIGEWYRPYGVKAITVSSVDMAQYFANAGWNDITIAFPANWRQVEAMDELAARINLGVLVESSETAQFLQKRLRHPVDAWIKVDVGAGRTGVAWQDAGAVEALAGAVKACGWLRLKGLLSHAGQTYHAAGAGEVRRIYAETVDRMQALKRRLKAAGFTGIEVSLGDTPACSLVDDLCDVDEIRPGNFVFFDGQQLQIGACAEEDVAVAVACPIVAKHPERGEVVIYGGAIHLSKEYIEVGGNRCYGFAAFPEGEGWGCIIQASTVRALSQEHGMVRLPPEALAKARLGDLLIIIPVHVCLTVDLLQSYRTLEGKRITTLGKPA